MQHFASAVVTEAHMIKGNMAIDLRKSERSLRILVLRSFREDFMGAFQTRESLSQLSSDLHDLHNRRDQEAHEKCVRKKSTKRKRAAFDLPRSHIHDGSSDHSQQQACGKTHHGCSGQRSNDVVEEPKYSR